MREVHAHIKPTRLSPPCWMRCGNRCLTTMPVSEPRLSRRRRRPLLAICLFTHHGRRDVLAEGLTSVFAQIETAGLSNVEVCLTDNASNDGTEALVAELKQKHGERLRYLRHERDLGLSRNLLSCVELARSDYCWILTSDDVIEDGGIARVIQIIALAGESSPASWSARRTSTSH